MTDVKEIKRAHSLKL